MIKMYLNLLFLLAVSISANTQEEKEVLQKVSSWPGVLQKAQNEKKLIFVDTYFTGCLPCAQMDKEVFPNEIVSKELLQNFVGVKVDVFKETIGETINMKYAVSGYPTFLILDANGNLLSMFTGFKDAGLLYGELAAAKQKAKKKETLSGFAATYNDSYPDFYKKIYSKDADKKIDAAVANQWIKNQTDWTAEPVALAIFRVRQLDTEVEDYLLANYKKYKAMYGEALARNRVTDILSARLAKRVNKQKDEEGFQNFLKENEKSFPAEDWKIIRFVLAYNYYNTYAKDVTVFLQFVNEHPVLYANYYSAVYSNLAAKKELTNTNLKLMTGWADKTMNEETALDLLRTAAYIHKSANDMHGFKRYLNMAIAKAKKYSISTEGYEKMLAGN